MSLDDSRNAVRQPLRNTFIYRLSRRLALRLTVNPTRKCTENFYRQIYRQKCLLESRRDMQVKSQTT
jgi:hypothetical protein